jgi:serine/threonine-protein kinase
MKSCPLCETTYPSHHKTCPTDGALLIESSELEPGLVIRGKYRIVRLLGRGGMGTVYLAEHIMLGRQRALKFISSELAQDAQFLRRFRREAQAAIELRHPNVVEVVDLDQAEDGSPYIAMEFVEGTDLSHALRAGAFPLERALAITRGVALGLGAAHDKNIIHRDVKPENILLAGGNGLPETPKLLDFGIAAMKEGGTAVSRTHGLMLTPPYASPEQWKGMAAEELDGRADLYALGGVLYEMLTGHTCFHAHNTEGWMYLHLQEEPQPPSRLRHDLEKWPGIDALALGLLAKDRDQRPRNAAELVEQIDAVYRPVSPKSTPVATPKISRRTIVEQPSLPGQYNTSSGVKSNTGSGAKPIPAPPRSNTVKWVVAAVVVLAVLGVLYMVQSSKSLPATAVPVLTPGGGTYAEQQSITISDATPGAIIHYTVDGNTPTKDSPVYVLPVAALPSGAVLRAMATADGHSPSPDVTGVYIWSALARTSANPQAGSVYDQGLSSYKNKQYAQARTLFSQACNGGELKACNYLGYMYAQGQGGSRDQSKAREVYQKACELNNFTSCASLGTLFQEDGNNNEARIYFKKACDGKLAAACDLLRSVQ